MRFLMRSLGLPVLLALVAACVSDSGGIRSPTGDAGAADAGASSSSSTSSSSSSGGEDAKPDVVIAPMFGCPFDPSRGILHLDQANAMVDAQERVTFWPNLVGPQQGQANGDEGEITRGMRSGTPAIKFDNRRVGTKLPNRRIEFRGLKTLSGPFALLVFGGHDYNNGLPEFDASSVGATYLFSSSGSARLQLMGQYHYNENGFDAFGALFVNGTQQDRSDSVGVYKNTDVLGGMHLFEVYDTTISGTPNSLATLFVDGVAQPTTTHPNASGASTGGVLTLGGSDRPDQMLAGAISEVVLLSDPTPPEINCIRQAMRKKYNITP